MTNQFYNNSALLAKICFCLFVQWRNRRGVGRVPPETSDREIFADLPGKKRQGKIRKGGGGEWRGRWKIENGRRGSYQMRRGLFFFFFFFSLFKTTKICFGCTKMKIFYRKKSISRREKNQEKMTLPLRKNSCYAPVCVSVFVCLFVLTAHNWQKWKRVFLTCPCHEIYWDEAVGLKSCKYTWKITIYVNMWNLGQFRENMIFCQ